MPQLCSGPILAASLMVIRAFAHAITAGQLWVDATIKLVAK